MKPITLWNVEPHPNIIQYSQLPSNSHILDKALTTHHFNCSVAVFIPCVQSNHQLLETINNGSDYYKLINVPLYRFVEKSFIDAFIKKGQTTLISLDTMIDVDNCCGITPNGLFVLSLTKDSFLSLGIQAAAPAINVKRQITDDKYQIVINLKADCFVPGKNNYQRVLERLKLSNLTMDVIAVWDADDKTISPSFVQYFNDLGIVNCICSLKINTKYHMKQRIPSIENTTSRQFFEWFGAFSLGIDNDEYYETLNMVEATNLVFIQWTGLISTGRVYNLFHELRKFIGDSRIPFIGLHVQGFDDSPLSWGQQAHQFVTNGDNNLSYIIQNDGTTHMCKNQIAPYT